MSSKHDAPPLDRRTLEWLDRRFPEQCPCPDDSDREVWMKAGERRAVRFALTILRKQENET